MELEDSELRTNLWSYCHNRRVVSRDIGGKCGHRHDDTELNQLSAVEWSKSSENNEEGTDETCWKSIACNSGLRCSTHRYHSTLWLL